MTLALAACHCGCQHPSADPVRRDRHAASHRAFEEWVAEMPDWHGFTAPSPRQIVEMFAGEYSVPRTCPRVEDVGKPNHPAHSWGLR